MKILITGGAGFIGTHLVRHLVNVSMDCEIPRQKDIAVYDIVNGHDIRNLHDLDKAFEVTQCDTVVHLAARAGVRRGNEYAHEYMSTNIEGTWNIGKMCEKYDCRLISFSSSSVYGNATPPTREHDPKNPVSLYGMTKLMGEHIVNRLTVPTVIIRPFTVYGPNGRGDQVFYKWLNQYSAGKPLTVYGDGNGKRGFTYVGDIVSAVKTLIGPWPWKEKHIDFNLGGEEVITTDEMLDVYYSLIPYIKVDRHCRPEIDIKENYADISKAKKMFGFNPPKQFKQNLEMIIRKELSL